MKGWILCPSLLFFNHFNNQPFKCHQTIALENFEIQPAKPNNSAGGSKLSGKEVEIIRFTAT